MVALTDYVAVHQASSMVSVQMGPSLEIAPSVLWARPGSSQRDRVRSARQRLLGPVSSDKSAIRQPEDLFSTYEPVEPWRLIKIRPG